MPVNANIPLHLVDEPEVAMRSDIPDDYLRALADDIQVNGLINPISVKRVGERYQLIAGHCRFLAHKLLNRDTIDAKDYAGDAIEPEAIKISENLMRHDVSDAEVATFLSDLQAKYHYDLETLMRLTRRSAAWIETRLALFQGDKAVFDALSSGLIKLGHAVTLNRFPDAFRAQYLETCINSTPPVKVVEQWLVDLKKMNLDGYVAAPGAPAEVNGTPLPGVVMEACEICGGNQLNWTMTFPRVHQHCMQMIQDKIREAAG